MKKAKAFAAKGLKGPRPGNSVAAKKIILGPKQVASLLFNLLFFPGLLFTLSGDWHWAEARVFCLWYFSVFGISLVYFSKKDPDLLRERFRSPGTGGQKGWDLLFLGALMVTLFTYYILIPLDAKRFAWSPPFPAPAKVLGFALLLIATYLIFRSMLENRFTSPYVRLQKDRGQKLISTGLYAVVRHPMYLGGLFFFFGIPLLLGSMVGLGLGVVLNLLFAVRIVGEEGMLLKELKGYGAYKKKVRYRLIPGVW